MSLCISQAQVQYLCHSAASLASLSGTSCACWACTVSTSSSTCWRSGCRRHLRLSAATGCADLIAFRAAQKATVVALLGPPTICLPSANNVRQVLQCDDAKQTAAASSPHAWPQPSLEPALIV